MVRIPFPNGTLVHMAAGRACEYMGKHELNIPMLIDALLTVVVSEFCQFLQ